MSDQYVTHAELNQLIGNQEKMRQQQFDMLMNRTVQLENSINQISSKVEETQKMVQSLNSGKVGVTDQNVSPGQMLFGGVGSQWTVANPAAVAEYNASKAAVNAGFYDCKNKKLYDMYGRKVDQQTLPIWTCEGDDPTIAIDREDNVTRMAYEDLQPYVRGVPFGLTL